MQNNEFCYKFNSKDKLITQIKLQPDHMNGGFLPKPDDTLYEDPSTIELGEYETLIISDEKWAKTPWYIGTKLYQKTDKTEMVIIEVGNSPSDYPDYTDVELSDQQYAYYYDYTESTDESGATTRAWVFNLAKYKSDSCKRITVLCVNENYTMFPQYKRDNVYSGSPVTDNYPDYLKGAAGQQSIANLNAIYHQISIFAQAAINAATITTRDAVDNIISAIVFPTEEQILTQLGVG